MEDREQLYELLAKKDWEAIGKIIYKNKKVRSQDPFLDQVTKFLKLSSFLSRSLYLLLSVQNSLSSLA